MAHDDDDPGIAFYEEMFTGPHIGEELPDEITRETEWLTQDKRRIRICDMGNRHLLNTIRVLRNMSPIGTKFAGTDVRRRQWLNAMATEAYLRHLKIDELTPEEEKETKHE